MIPISRHTDALAINDILNHPQVRPWVASESKGVLDVSSAVHNPDNILLMGEFGGVVFFKLMPGVYEAHTQVLPQGRGNWTRELTEACAQWMFTRTDAYEIITRVPHGHRAARAAAMGAGLRFEFTVDRPIQFRGRDVLVDIYSGRIQDWAATAPGMVETGEWLHERFQDEAERMGLLGEPTGIAAERGMTGKAHPDMPGHNRAVGIGYHMAVGGQPIKAVEFYNRWAIASHRPPEFLARILSFDPITIRLENCNWTLLPDGDVELSL